MTICGDCFGWALANARGPKDVLVHAKVKDPWTGKRYWHAYVERGSKILDWQSAQGLGPGRKGWSKKTFEETYQPTQQRRYASDRANVCALRTRHAGPWRDCK